MMKLLPISKMTICSVKAIPDAHVKSLSITIDSFNDFDSFDNFTIKVADETFLFQAIGDCCSTSKFKVFKQPFSTLINKTIIDLSEISLPDDFEEEDDNDDGSCYVSTHLYQFSFKEDGEPFKFILVNYSNGYYDGWITIEKQ